MGTDSEVEEVLGFGSEGEECLGADGIQKPIHYLLLFTEGHSCTSLEYGIQQDKKKGIRGIGERLCAGI